MLLIIETLGGVLLEGRSTDLYNEVFHGAVRIQVGEEIKESPMRPSDVVALAVRKKRPIFTTEETLLQAGRAD